MIVVNRTKSNSSSLMVWQVAITGETFVKYCKSPLKALRLAFLLKKSKGVNIAMETIASLKQEISHQKERLQQPDVESIEVQETSVTMRRFKEFKSKHPDALLLFRNGDFFTAYYQDAEDISDILGIAITKKGKRITASFPYDALDTYLPKLVRAGKRVAICETKTETAA